MKKIYKAFLFLIISSNVFSQENLINKKSNNLTYDGNIEFSDKNLVEAEFLYRQAISKDSMNNIASYNMANSFYNSGFNKEAINQYKLSIKKAKNKKDLHKSYHNLGDVYMRNKDYQNAVNSFKNALLNNPSDDETRYNYALAKELLKNEEKNKNNNKKDQSKKENKGNKDKKDNKKDKNKKGDKDKENSKKEKNKKNNKGDKNNDKENNKKNKNKKDKPRPNQISPEQLKNLLKAMNNEEKKVQDKINKNKIKGTPKKNKKDW
jgi:hypothetical protein